MKATSERPDIEQAEIVFFPSPVVGELVARPLAITVDENGGAHEARVQGTVIGLITQLVPRRDRQQYNPRTGEHPPDQWVGIPRTWALVARTENEVIDDLTRRLATAEENARKAWEDFKAMNAQNDHLSKQIDILKQKVESERAAAARAEEAQGRVALRTVKLEGDLAKIRAHVGQKAIDEALAKP